MKTSSVKEYETRLLRVLEHIDANLTAPSSLQELAGIAHFSPFHFHRIFRGMTGETIGGYIRRRRLEVAGEQLVSQGHSVTCIAFDAGFENSESFSRAFKTHFGMSPSQYRSTGKSLMTSRTLKAARLGMLHSQARALAHYMATEGRRTMFDVEIKNIPEIHVASMRHTGPYNECGAAFEQLCSKAAQENLFRQDTVSMSICYDDPHSVEAEKLRCDVCITVPEDTTVTAPMQSKTIPAGDYAVALHKGSYDGLQAAYDWLFGQWLPHSGREATDESSIEVYLTDPSTTRPEDNLTEIRIPLV
ncbi:AraC family transcriptional regulator [uncultured Cohaesibacter sp.]|uniref:AraC family transcriptional regulator n=1 Tax=uncultured Cohaesibacter sp. TaxID=1002546 RepID=UPI002AAADBA3|nr:AraC family transcriptional regulator [uncultured Cohaesibacter sp.]